MICGVAWKCIIGVVHLWFVYVCIFLLNCFSLKLCYKTTCEPLVHRHHSMYIPATPKCPKIMKSLRIGDWCVKNGYLNRHSCPIQSLFNTKHGRNTMYIVTAAPAPPLWSVEWHRVNHSTRWPQWIRMNHNMLVSHRFPRMEAHYLVNWNESSDLLCQSKGRWK